MNFNKELELRCAGIDAILKKYLPKEEGFQEKIMEAMNYSILAGGKRLRPMLMKETYQLFGGTNKEMIEPFMAAIEMIHTYSLVHDDLPAMDNDEYRRGRKTTHAQYGEAMGILAGDALLNYAFETAVHAFDSQKHLLRVADALKVLSNKAGIYGMIGGQVVDVLSCEEELELDKIEFIHQLKTSALIESSMMIGAILAGAKEEEVKEIEIAAGMIGLAFQIQDDILDVTSTNEILGKPVHSDEKNHKMTYVARVGLENAKLNVEKYSNEALLRIEQINGKNIFLEELILYLIERKK